MKKHFARLFLFAAVAMVAFAGCEKDNDEKDNNNGNNTNNNEQTKYPTSVTSNDGTVAFVVENPTWEGRHATYVWQVKISGNARLSNYFDDREGWFSFGIGYFPLGVEDGMPRYFNGNNETNRHEIISANADSTELTIRSYVKADNLKQARAFVYLTDGEFHYSDQFYINPDANQGGNQGGDVNIDNINFTFTQPRLVSQTATTMTVTSTIDISQKEGEALMNSNLDWSKVHFGFVYVATDDGEPNLQEALAGNGTPQHIAYCTDNIQTMMQNRGAMTVTFDVMEGVSYNVMPFVILVDKYYTGKWCTLGGDNGGGTIEVEAWLPIDRSEGKTIAAWYTCTTLNPSWTKVEAIFLFTDNTLVKTDHKVYSAADGRPEEKEIDADGTYQITSGDYTNGAAAVTVGEMNFTAQIVNGVLTAMDADFIKQDNAKAPAPSLKDGGSNGSGGTLEVEAWLPIDRSEGKTIAAWYTCTTLNSSWTKVEAIFLFTDNTLVKTDHKVYSEADGRPEEKKLDAEGSYQITSGDYTNGAAAVTVGEMNFTAQIANGVLSAMDAEFIKQDNAKAPAPSWKE